MAFLSALNHSSFAKSKRPLLCNSAPGRARVRGARKASMTAAPVGGTTSVDLEQFFKDAGDLGTIRFITVGNGSVLETIGRFDYNINRFEVPTKGAYITLANEDKTFECHINTSKVAAVTMGKETSKMGAHDLYVIRLKNADDCIVLSCVLMWDPSYGPGTYMHGAIDAFNRLKAKYGDKFSFQSA